MHGARILGQLDLSNLHLEFPVRFISCAFDFAPIITNLRIASFAITNCFLPGLHADGITTIGDFQLDNSVVRGPTHAHGARIGGLLSFQGCAMEAKKSGLFISDAIIEGSLNLDNLRLSGRIAMRNVRIDGAFSIQGTTVISAGEFAARFAKVSIGDSLYVIESTFTSALVIDGCAISSQLVITDTSLSSIKRDALLIRGSQIGGTAFLDHELRIQGAVVVEGTRIGGDLRLSEAKIYNPSDVALMLNKVNVGGYMRFMDADCVGTFQVWQTAIGGDLVLDGSKFTPGSKLADVNLIESQVWEDPHADTILLSDLSLAGSLHLDRDLEIFGTLRLQVARISGTIHLGKISLYAKFGASLHIGQSEIRGGITFKNRMAATGTIQILESELGGITLFEADSASGEANGASGSLDSASLNIIFEGCSLNTLEVRVPSANRYSIAFDASRLKVLRSPEPAFSTHDLPVLVGAHGLLIEGMTGHIRTSHEIISSWLTKNSQNFSPQPLHAVASVFDEYGQHVDARRMRFKAAGLATHSERRALPLLLRYLYCVTTGYGYYPLLAVLWLALFFVVTSVFFTLQAASFLYLAPTAEPLVTGADSCSVNSGRLCFDAIRYAAETILPFIPRSQTTNWAPFRETNLFTFVTIGITSLSWAMIAILAFGVTGLLKRSP
ncbi:hypothetical protein [Rathayibacter sp. VKM Ac-2926]|uniref:hypothetical protein n=1 Tax=Rathayibacter sp. VKM Ac-2926 TaxID=2929477 RepID=UPI001FB2AD57|nr:hypothetical protein [Rathayibacter sp. VKM Ac-2926]MCJ1703335.1 hypothetical protein [Rathayibacter sp. VKM Ac-2926]